MKKIIVLAIVMLAVSGCSLSFDTGSGTASDGGIFVSENKGETWMQRTLIPTSTGKPKSIASLSANALSMDPNDHKALYFSSIEDGLIYTYDAGANWNIATGLGKVQVAEAAVDPGSKCIIYAAVDNKLYKSNDCNRSFRQVYYDTELSVKVNAIAVNYFDPAIVFIGTSRGDIIKSTDRGETWRTIKRADNGIAKILVSPYDSKMILAATFRDGLLKSANGGETWTEIKDSLKEFKNGLTYMDFAFAESESGLVFMATKYGLLKSEDNGETWSEIELITPKEDSTIYALAVSPQNAKEIYYTTNTTFYRTADGGSTWATKKLPTSRAGWKLLVDPENTNIIYLAVRKLK